MLRRVTCFPALYKKNVKSPRGLGNAGRGDDFQPDSAWKFLSEEMCRSTGCAALRNVGVFLCVCFQEELVLLWCFERCKKKGGRRRWKQKKSKKKQNFISQANWRARFAPHIHNRSIFWGSKAAFEARRYVLIIWRLNDDTRFIINGPHPSTLPLPLTGPPHPLLITVQGKSWYQRSPLLLYLIFW